jgi:hypothetical protein
MKYSIRAQPKIDQLPTLWTILTDGTVEKQEPDGREIIASMKRAVIVNGEARWSETCFCNPPLLHERNTVYDRFFTEMEIKPLKDLEPPGGDLFWDYMRQSSNKQDDGSSQPSAPTQVRYVPIRIL